MSEAEATDTAKRAREEDEAAEGAAGGGGTFVPLLRHYYFVCHGIAQMELSTSYLPSCL